MMSRRQKKDSGFTLLEILSVMTALAIISAIALPSAFNALAGYRVHSDAAGIASFFNIARMRAAAQYAPYRINIAISSGTYTMEKLCGDTPSTVDSACTSAYAAFTTPQIESGTQYSMQGDTFASCRPSGITMYPGTITADPAGCPSLVQFYFNTRGAPTDGAGNPLANGGAIVYLNNQNNMVDALTVAVGGRVSVWNWDSSATQWYLR